MGYPLYQNSSAEEWTLGMYREGHKLGDLLRKQDILLKMKRISLREPDVSPRRKEILEEQLGNYEARIKYITTLRTLGLSDQYTPEEHDHGTQG